MHISLDSALGRQRRLNSVGESVFQIAPDAAAGYSLRSLTGGDPAVVRVRRESDNNERDFRSSEINSGGMVRWVNEQITPPLDLRELTATGRDGPIIEAAAAYSLRNLSDSYTGDVVEVRRNTDGALKDFKASEVTDGTLEAWVNTSFADALPLDTASGAAAAYSLRNLSSSYTGSVVDVRRSSDGNTESFTAAEVADGTLEAWVSEEQVGWNLQPTWDVSSGDGVITSQSKTATTSTFSITTTSGASFVRQSSKPNHIIASSGDQVVANITLSGFDSGFAAKLRTSGTNINVASQTLTNGTADYTFTLTGSAGYFAFTGVEATSGATLTVNSIKVIGQSGFVSKWYDQSGNDNHATQGTPASQPKIVDGGSLVTGGLEFDGTNDQLDFTGLAAADLAIFSVARFDIVASQQRILGADSGNADGFGLANATTGFFRASGGTATQPALNATLTNTADFLYSGTRSSNSLTFFTNGTASAVATNSDTFNADSIGGGTLPINGKLQEVIIYNSDESDKRRAIEENIGSTYGITLTSSKDGTVSKWYDQSTTSGVPNANHAVQTSAGSQPKIVDGGTLVAGGIDFDGVNDALLSTSSYPTTSNIAAFFVADSTGTDNRVLDTRGTGAAGTVQGWFTRFSSSGGISLVDDGSASFGTSNIIRSGKSLATVLASQTIIEDYTNGTLSASATGSIGSFYSGNPLIIGANSNGQNTQLFDGTIGEVIVYNTDQTDNRTALEANIGEVYGIAGIPAYEDTVNGFVETWYDQSGNGNDATQLTASYQPKIVSAGALVQEGGNASLEFDGVDDYLATTQGYIVEISQNPASVFAVANPDGLSEGYLLTEGDSPSTYSSSFILNGSGSIARATLWVNATKFGSGFPASLTLGGFIYNGTNFQAYLNGATDGASGTADINAETSIQSYIGTRADGTTDFFAGKVSEIITYKSDQSANRPAIEANINNQYDIY